MYRSLSLTVLSCASLFLAACDKPVAETHEVGSRLVKSFTIQDAGGGQLRQFPATIDAHRKADLAFRVSGNIKELLVLEGQKVTAGEVLMRLDQTDFEITRKDRQARFSRASNDFKRGKELVGKGHISRTDFDQLEAEFTSTKAALQQAKQDLLYTTLTAPFDGSIAARLVEQHEEIRAKQTVIELRDAEQLDVIFDAPENLIRSLKRTVVEEKEGPSKAGNDIKVSVKFDGSDQSYPASFKEASTRADPKTQTFKVTYTLPTPDDLRVLPGMTAHLTADLSALDMDDSLIYSVPLGALSADANLQAGVWRVNPDSMQVDFQPVTTGNMQADSVQILSGLNEGDIIVTAGSAYLSKGMTVRLMPNKEQAEHRKNDPAKPVNAEQG